jgi:hypothetical protein
MNRIAAYSGRTLDRPGRLRELARLSFSFVPPKKKNRQPERSEGSLFDQCVLPTADLREPDLQLADYCLSSPIPEKPDTLHPFFA